MNFWEAVTLLLQFANFALSAYQPAEFGKLGARTSFALEALELL